MFLVVVPAKKAGYRGMTFVERAAARLARGLGGFDYVSRCVGHCSLMIVDHGLLSFLVFYSALLRIPSDASAKWSVRCRLFKQKLKQKRKAGTM